MQQSSMPKGLKWFGIITIILTIAYFIIYIAFGSMDQEEDPVIKESGVGASRVEPAYSGLLREWSPLNEPADMVCDTVLGIELENSVCGEVYENYAYNSTLDILSVSMRGKWHKLC